MINVVNAIIVSMHIHIVPNRNSKPAVLLRESYRVGGSVRKRTLANLSKLPMDAVDAIKRILKGEKLVSLGDAFEIVENGSRLHGHVDAVLSAMRQLGFEKLVASRHSRERDLVVAMVAARILEPQSKLATSLWWHTTTLPEILGVSDAKCRSPGAASSDMTFDVTTSPDSKQRRAYGLLKGITV